MAPSGWGFLIHNPSQKFGKAGVKAGLAVYSKFSDRDYIEKSMLRKMIYAAYFVA
jgi:hypothetical protein